MAREKSRRRLKLSINSNGRYGREREVDVLKEAFESIGSEDASTCRYVVVGGRSGSGKSFLVESYPWSNEKNCHFISGHFTKKATQEAAGSGAEETPYAAIREAFKELCIQWGKRSRDECLKFCKTELVGLKGIVQSFLPDLAQIGGLSTLEEVDQSYCSIASSIGDSSRKPLPMGNSLSVRTLQSTGSGSSVTLPHQHNLIRGPSTRVLEDAISSGSRFPSETISTVKRHEFRRLRTVLFKLLKRIASPSRPVVLFMDDIQWADSESIEMIEYLVLEPDIKGLLIVSSYRSEEVYDSASKDGMLRDEDCPNSSHPISDHINRVQSLLSTKAKANPKEHPLMETIDLQGFTVEELKTLFAKLTHKSEEETTGLAEVVHTKTNGNPFFVDQCLRMLQREGHLSYSFTSGRWDWKNAEEVKKAISIVSTEVADVVASSIESMDKNTRDVLAVSSCIGSQIPIHILDEYFATPLDCSFDFSFSSEDVKLDAFDVDGDAGNEEAVQPMNLKAILEDLVSSQVLKRPNSRATVYLWSHEKIQQAAFSLMPERKKHRTRVKLGSTILGMSSWEISAKFEGLLYIAANQFNQVPALVLKDVIGSDETHLKLVDIARLNLQAAKLSISKSAYLPAKTLLKTGIKILKPGKDFSLLKSSKGRKMDPWEDNYELFLDLHQHLFEAEYLLGNREASREVIQTVLVNSKNLDDRLRAQACLLEIMSSGDDRNYGPAIAKCQEILEEFGINIPKQPGPIRIRKEKRRLNAMLPGENIEALATFPQMKDMRANGISMILGMLATYTILAGMTGMTHLVVLKLFQLACESGINSYIASGVADYGLALRYQGKREKSYKMGVLAMDILKVLDSMSVMNHAKTATIVHSALLPLKRPLHDSLDAYVDSFGLGLQTGDVEYALLAVLCYGMHYLFVGLPLAPFAADSHSWGKDANMFGLPTTICCMFDIFEQTVECLQGKAPDPSSLNGNVMDQEELLGSLEGPGHSMTHRDICIYRLMLSYIHRDFETAEEVLNILCKFKFENPAISRMHTRAAFSGLVAYHLYRKTKSMKYRRIAKDSYAYFKKEAKFGSLNAYPLYCLLQAEDDPSKESYDHAIRVCSRSGLMNFEAMANESAAIMFFEKKKDDEWGKVYLERAIGLYADWGCTEKVKQMKTKYGIHNIRQTRIATTHGSKGSRKYGSQFLSLRNMELIKFDEDELSPAMSRTMSSSLLSRHTSSLLLTMNPPLLEEPHEVESS